MTPENARRVAAHCRRLLTARILTPHDYAVVDAMLWRLRRSGRWDLAAPYISIARLAGVCRDTAINSVRKLTEIGLIMVTKRRVLVQWGRGGGHVASRQIANAYVFKAIETESAAKPTDKGLTRIQVGSSVLEAALSRLNAAIFAHEGTG